MEGSTSVDIDTTYTSDIARDISVAVDVDAGVVSSGVTGADQGIDTVDRGQVAIAVDV